MAETKLDVPQERPFYLSLLLWMAILFTLLAAGFGVVQLYARAKIWRAHFLVQEANGAVAEHKTAEINSDLMAALALAPRDAGVLRAIAAYQVSNQDPQALNVYRVLIAAPGSTREDRRAAARAFLSFGDLRSAAQVVQILMNKTPGADDYALEAQIYWQAGAAASAVSTMRQAVAMAPENRASKLLLAKMLAMLPGQDTLAEAVNDLRDLAQTQDAQGLGALEVMARNPRLDPASQQWTLDQLRQHPLLDDEGRFAAWELEKRMGKRDGEAVMGDAVAFFKSADLARKAVAARWLYNQGEAPLALDLADLPDALSSQSLFLVRLDALAYLKNWAEVEKELSTPQVPLTETLTYLYRARAAEELGDAGGSEANWNRARMSAITSPGMLSYLGQYAVKLGLYDEAKKTYTQMAHIPDQAQAGYDALLQVDVQHGTDAETLDTLKQMMTDLPSLPEPKNDWAYLSLLLNKNVSEARATAQALVDAHPDVLAYRSTLALACVRQNDAAGAERVYDGLNIDWSHAPASWRMIYAVVLSANGDKAQAAAFAAAIERSHLRPAEQTLLDSYLPGTP